MTQCITEESAEQQDDYRQVSLLSIVSLLLGLASPLALIAPLLLVVPLLGATLALFAVVQIAKREGQMIGRRAALLGLALCVVSFGAMWGRSITTRHLVSQQAQDFAYDWLALLAENQPRSAFQLTDQRHQPAAPQDRSQPGEEATQDPFDTFAEDELISTLLNIHDVGVVRFDKNIAMSKGPRGQYHMLQQYEIMFVQNEMIQPITFQLLLKRFRKAPNRQPQWLVEKFEVVEEKEAR